MLKVLCRHVHCGVYFVYFVKVSCCRTDVVDAWWLGSRRLRLMDGRRWRTSKPEFITWIVGYLLWIYMGYMLQVYTFIHMIYIYLSIVYPYVMHVFPWHLFIVHYKNKFQIHSAASSWKLYGIIWTSSLSTVLSKVKGAYLSQRLRISQLFVLGRSWQVPDSPGCPKMGIPKDRLAACFLAPSWYHLALSENVGYIPNEIAICYRDNDH